MFDVQQFLSGTNKESIKVDTRTDPFKKQYVTDVDILGGYPMFKKDDSPFEWYARIRVSNGNTNGTITTEKYTEFLDVVKEVQRIINDLK